MGLHQQTGELAELDTREARSRRMIEIVGSDKARGAQAAQKSTQRRISMQDSASPINFEMTSNKTTTTSA